MFSATSVDLCEDNGEGVRPEAAARVAEKSEYFRTHVPNFPHSFTCFGQCCPCGQQLDCAAMMDESGERARISAPSTGSIATERAITATRTVRTKLMTSLGVRATFSHGQVTEP